MPAFRLSKKGASDATRLSIGCSLSNIIEDMRTHLSLLDKSIRTITDPSVLLKTTGKAQMLSEILDSLTKPSPSHTK